MLFLVVDGRFTLMRRGLVEPRDIFLSLTSTISVAPVSPLSVSPFVGAAVLSSCIPFLMILVLLDEDFRELGIL